MSDVKRILVGTLFTGLRVYKQVFVTKQDSKYVIEPFEGKELHSTVYVSRVAVIKSEHCSNTLLKVVAATGSVQDVERELTGMLSSSLQCDCCTLVDLSVSPCIIDL